MTEPKISDRIYLVERNHEAMTALIGDSSHPHDEWIATIACYKAIQLVEILLTRTQGHPSTSHTKRLERLRAHHAPIYKQYRPLYNASMVARYLCLTDPNTKATQYFTDFGSHMNHNVVDHLIKGRLVQLESLISGIIPDQFTKTRV